MSDKEKVQINIAEKNKYNNTANDLKISGSGSTGGGSYNQVKISGSGAINGDIECNTFLSSGCSKIFGNIKSGYMSTSGMSKVQGNVISSEMKVSGNVSVTGNVEAGIVGISGRIKINGNLSSEKISISGSAKIMGDCEAETFKSSGGFEIGGLLNAGEININIAGICKVKEIGGEKIRIKLGNYTGGIIGSIVKAVINQREQVITQVIEGDEIYLENTVAEVVRGKNIKIGSGCEIERVEYIDKILVEGDSNVGERVKL